MILPSQHIRARIGMVTPFAERTIANGMSYGVGPAGYDVRIREMLYLPPGGFSLASTVESFDIPSDVIAKVHDKSTWARRGIALQNTIAEPGWRGVLTLEITNHGRSPVSIDAGSPIAQIVFHLLAERTSDPYDGKYQDQPAGPVAAIFEDATK